MIGETMQYDNSFKQEALELSDEIGVRKAAEQLGISYYTLTDWRYIRKHQGDSYFVGIGYKRKPVDEKDRRIQELEAELRETKGANEILKGCPRFFRRKPKEVKAHPCYEHSLAHAQNSEPSGTRRVYIDGYATKYGTVTEGYIIGYT